MDVFISWSGTVSHKVACILRDWIPSVIQAVSPYVSSEDIDKGARWSSDIAKELDGSSYGILCLTKKNVHAPWLNFEAGALSKAVDKSRVCPFLFHMERSDVTGPLLQFQSTLAEKQDVLKMACSINLALPEKERLNEDRLNKVFEVWWPSLEESLNKIEEPQPDPNQDKSEEIDAAKRSAMLEEILELTRNQQRRLANPEALLPRGYLEHVLRHNKIHHKLPDHPRIIFAQHALKRLMSMSLDPEWKNEVPPAVRENIEELITSMDYIFDRWLDN